ncbi:hypothetical protein [Sphingomonas sp.]|jgi:hypothetical protein|uniref:hypothetical protein n=1 Tax=Sphingomonas sp. TaxID=28214 RepID=UPI002ED86F97
MILSLALLALAPDPFPAPRTPTAVLQISCRQGECRWQKIQRIERMRGGNGEVLRKLTSRAGMSVHLNGRIPARYSPRLRIEWERAPKIEYVLYSKRRPTTIFGSADSEFVVTRLGLGDMAGYEYAGGTLYMQICHNIAPSRWTERQIQKLGYGKKRGVQDRYPTLAEALAALR